MWRNPCSHFPLDDQACWYLDKTYEQALAIDEGYDNIDEQKHCQPKRQTVTSGENEQRSPPYNFIASKSIIELTTWAVWLDPAGVCCSDAIAEENSTKSNQKTLIRNPELIIQHQALNIILHRHTFEY